MACQSPQRNYGIRSFKFRAEQYPNYFYELKEQLFVCFASIRKTKPARTRDTSSQRLTSKTQSRSKLTQTAHSSKVLVMQTNRLKQDVSSFKILLRCVLSQTFFQKKIKKICPFLVKQRGTLPEHESKAAYSTKTEECYVNYMHYNIVCYLLQ